MTCNGEKTKLVEGKKNERNGTKKPPGKQKNAKTGKGKRTQKMYQQGQDGNLEHPNPPKNSC